MNRLIYFDNAATTKLSKPAYDAMLPFLGDEFGNPSSIYSIGRNAKNAIENARGRIADAIGALPEEIYFVGGGTESDNWAIKSVAEMRRSKGRHIITSAIEHPAVLNTVKHLEKEGYDVTRLSVDGHGQISLDELRSRA